MALTCAEVAKSYEMQAQASEHTLWKDAAGEVADLCRRHQKNRARAVRALRRRAEECAHMAVSLVFRNAADRLERP